MAQAQKRPEPGRQKAPGIVPFESVMDANTGRFLAPSKYREGRLGQERLRRQTEDMADKLESVGVTARIPSRLSMITDVTRQVIQLPAYRNKNILPAVAQANRRSQINDLQYFIETVDPSPFWRYAVITFGDRVDAFSGLRGAMRRAKDLMRQWRYACVHQFGIEFAFTGIEFPRNADGSYHLHANILYKTPYFEDGGEAFRAFTREHFGTWWKDNGRIKNHRELCKYPFKPADIEGCEGDELAWLDSELHKARISEFHGELAAFRRNRKAKGLRVSSMGGKLILRPASKVFMGRSDGDEERVSTSNPVNIIVSRILPSFHTPWAEGATLVMNYDPDTIQKRARERLDSIREWQWHARQAWDAKKCPDPETAKRFAQACMAAENVRALWDSEAHYIVHNETISVFDEEGEVFDFEDDFSLIEPPDPPDPPDLPSGPRLIIDNTAPKTENSPGKPKQVDYLSVFDRR